MISVDVFDDCYPETQRPFRCEFRGARSGSLSYFSLQIDRANMYVSRARLAELHAVIGAVLEVEAPQEAGVRLAAAAQEIANVACNHLREQFTRALNRKESILRSTADWLLHGGHLEYGYLDSAGTHHKCSACERLTAILAVLTPVAALAANPEAPEAQDARNRSSESPAAAEPVYGEMA